MHSVLFILIAIAQDPGVVAANQKDGKWEHGRNDAPGVESLTLREDAVSGAVELIARYPAGHQFAQHWHNSNERIASVRGAALQELAREWRSDAATLATL